jgi:hypothetical protein
MGTSSKRRPDDIRLPGLLNNLTEYRIILIAISYPTDNVNMIFYFKRNICKEVLYPLTLI